MFAKKLKIASLIITYNFVNETKAQMDIIREMWEPMFESVDIYHEFNGKKSWYPQKYKEDFLHRHKSMSHFIGATHLLNEGIKHILESKIDYDFIIVTSADTWFYDPKKLKDIILTMHNKKYELATSLWGGITLATEFFVITPNLGKKVFPLNFMRILKNQNFLRWTHRKIAVFESIFTVQVMKVLKNPNKIYLIPGRKVVLFTNRYSSPNFYASHHDQDQRKKDIPSKILNKLGSKIERMPELSKFLV